MAGLVFRRVAVRHTVMDVIQGGRSQKPMARARNTDVASLLRALAVPALLLDRAGRIVDVNEAAEKLMARDRSDLLEESVDQVLGDATGAREGGPQSLSNRALRGEQVESGRQFFRSNDGERFPVSVAVRPVHDSAGKLSGALLAIKDLTEVDQLQRELEHSERHVAVGEMAAGLVHDFNNVFSTISECLVVLESSCNSEHDRMVLDIMRKELHRGSETLENVRRYLAGRQRQSSRVNIRGLLEEVLELTSPILMTHSAITVIRDLQACGEVDASPDELRRAFTNLVLNALEAMPRKGSLTVACRQFPGQVVVSVHDTGAGIPLAVQKRIFSAYFTTKPNGTGLGLVGARRAIEAHGGNIRFESAPGQGTTFFVTLPTIATQQQQRQHQPSAHGEPAQRKVS